MLTPVLMNGTKIEQNFLVENDMEICGLNISFATYKRQVNSIVEVVLIDGFKNVIFAKSINSFKDNAYTKIEMPNIKLEGGMYYQLVLVSHSNNMFNAVALWYDKSEGSTLKANSRTFQNSSINFKFDEQKSNAIESIAEVIEVKKRRRTGKPKKTVI